MEKASRKKPQEDLRQQSLRQEERPCRIFHYPSPRKGLRLTEIELWAGLLLTDTLALALALLLGLLTRNYLGELFPSLPYFDLSEHLRRFLEKAWLFFPLPLVFLWQGLYRRLPFWEELRRLFVALTTGFLLVLALISLAKLGLYLSRLTILLTGAFSLFLLPLFRTLAKKVAFRFKRYRIPALVCPASREGLALLKSLTQEPSLGYEVVGLLDDDPRLWGKDLFGYRVFGPLRQIGKFARLKGVDAVFLAANSKPLPWLEDLYAYLQRNVREIYLVPQFMDLGLFNAQIFFLFSGKTTLIRVFNPLGSRLNQALKRGMDLLGGGVLLLLSLPLMLLIALLIRLDSPGPVLFTQERVGRGGRKFRIYKFRTMLVDSEERLSAYLEAHPELREKWFRYRKLDNDPRVTRVGRWLRRYSLDELPQLLNVLKGEMSLVGPRPILEEELKSHYGDRIHFYTVVRPGLTGLWQVSGRNKLPFEDRIRLDLWYVQNWSPWLDLIILLKTVPVVLKAEGSY